MGKIDQLIIELTNLKPELTDNSLSNEKLTIEFNLLRSKYEIMKKKYSSLDTLSMGMSNDYLLAIKNGSNLVRIGSKIFGKRT